MQARASEAHPAACPVDTRWLESGQLASRQWRQTKAERLSTHVGTDPAFPRVMHTRALKVLVVGPHPALLRALHERDEPVEVEIARDAFDAIDRIDCASAPYSAIFCDIDRADLPGPELWAYLSISRADAAARMVFVASAPPSLATQAFLDRVPNACVHLPEDVEAIPALVERAMSRPSAVRAVVEARRWSSGEVEVGRRAS
ncbi:MAG TPA: hypothetical protein VGI39_31575 [Polyangiaceae bacterium]